MRRPLERTCACQMHQPSPQAHVCLVQERAAERQLLTEDELQDAVAGIQAAASGPCLGLAPGGDRLRRVLAEEQAPDEVGLVQSRIAERCIAAPCRVCISLTHDSLPAMYALYSNEAFVAVHAQAVLESAI